MDKISLGHWATPLFLAQSELDTLLREFALSADRMSLAKSSSLHSLRLLFQFNFVIISRLSRDALEPRLIEGHRIGPVRKSSHQFSLFSDNFPDSLATEESTRLWQRLLLQATAKCLKHCRRGTPCESFARMKIPGSAASWVLFKPSTLWTKWNSHARIVQTDSKPF